MGFEPARIAAYKLAREHSREVRLLLDKVQGRGFSDLVDQLRRSTTSIPANVLEAVGEWRPRKRLHYFMIAKGSACEAWAHTDSLIDFGLVTARDVSRVRSLQARIIAVLIASIRNTETAESG